MIPEDVKHTELHFIMHVHRFLVLKIIDISQPFFKTDNYQFSQSQDKNSRAINYHLINVHGNCVINLSN